MNVERINITRPKANSAQPRSGGGFPCGIADLIRECTRRPRTEVLLRFSLLVPLVFATAASAQQALVLAPDSHRAAAGDGSVLSLRESTKADALPVEWPADIEWFYIRLAGTQENRAGEDAPKPVKNRVTAQLPRAGAAKIGIDLSTRTAEWPASVLADFAARAGRAEVCPDRPARVRHQISAATLIRVNDKAGNAAPDAAPTSKAGQRAEIRPLFDPTDMPPGGDLAVRVYLAGDAAANAAIVAVHIPSGTQRRVTTDAKGIAAVSIDRPGRWVLEAHHLRPSDGADAEWSATSVTLSFEVPEPPPNAPNAPPKAATKNGGAP